MPRGSVPLVSELEARIDEALVIARASEDGVREVGEMALDAARQARRAAEAAEKSAKAAVEARKMQPKPEPAAVQEAPVEVAPTPEPRFEVRFRRFNERADRLSARLRAFSGSSAASGRPRGDH